MAVVTAATLLGPTLLAGAAVKKGVQAITPKPPEAPGAPPAPPTRDDPAVAAARERLRLSEKRRRGRRAAILTSGRGVETPAGLIRRTAAIGTKDTKLGLPGSQ